MADDDKKAEQKAAKAEKQAEKAQAEAATAIPGPGQFAGAEPEQPLQEDGSPAEVDKAAEADRISEALRATAAEGSKPSE